MMSGKIGALLGVLAGFGLICSACSGTSTTTKGSSGSSGVGGFASVGGAGGLSGVGGSMATPTACAANEAICDGKLATKCKADGSGPQPGGVDCSESKQHCLLGECSDAECIAGTKSCVDGDVYVCEANGSSRSIWSDCTEDQVCDADLGFCLTRICEPGQTSCDGTRVSTCNDFGSGWLRGSADCAAEGNVCIAGSCVKKVCTPSTTFCKDKNLYQCDPTGASSTLSKTCRPGFEHCEVTPAGLYAYCVLNQCEPGNQLCAGDVIKTCNADGTVPAQGTACAKDEFCQNAECKPRLCNIDTLFCQGKSIYSCGFSGPSLYTECDPGDACLAVIPNPEHGSEVYPDMVSCRPLLCPPGQTGCVLNAVGTCGSDGASLSAVTNDCNASGTVCTASGLCAASVTDTLGTDEIAQALQASPYVGNVIDVRSARKLTGIEMLLVFTSPRDVRWMIYEQVGSEFIPRAEKTTSIASSTGFISSGPLSYQLQAGKHYALGAIMPGDSIGFNANLSLEQNPSFGAVLGSVETYNDFSSFSIAPSFLPYTVSYMKVTTAAP